jgi:hypothetical protein
MMNLSSPFSIPLLLGLLFRMNGSHGYSIANNNNNEYARNADQSFSQLSVVRQTMALSMSQQREPIRMPSSNPMVPYKVSPSLIFHTHNCLPLQPVFGEINSTRPAILSLSTLSRRFTGTAPCLFLGTLTKKPRTG